MSLDTGGAAAGPGAPPLPYSPPIRAASPAAENPAA